MNISYTKDESSGRLTAMTLFAKDGIEEIFLTEVHRVLCRPTIDDQISVTRISGEDRLVWKPLRKGNEE